MKVVPLTGSRYFAFDAEASEMISGGKPMEGRTVQYEKPRFVVKRLDPASFAGQYCVLSPTQVAPSYTQSDSNLATR